MNVKIKQIIPSRTPTIVYDIGILLWLHNSVFL